ncbi:MAG: energy transducer TonB [Acidobacteriota bacterium]
MYKLLLVIVFTVLIGGSLGATKRALRPDPDWERFRAVKEGFSAQFPEWPAVVNRGQYRAAPVRAARNYAAYHEGSVYFVIAFENPNREKSIDYFLDTQLRVNELRNCEISAGVEISNSGAKGMQYSVKKFDYRKSFSLPGIVRLYETRNRVLAVIAIGKDETDSAVKKFLDSLEITDNPKGKDIGAGATYSDSAVSGDEPASTSQLSRRVLIMIKPDPPYTDDARRRKLRGGVILKAVLAASGRVTNIQVVSGIPELAQSAVEVAHKIYFIPAVKDGRFISTTVQLEYSFNIY